MSHFYIYHYGKKRFGRKCLCGIVFCDDEDCIFYHTLECNAQKIHITIPDAKNLKLKSKHLVISKPIQNRLVDKQYLIDLNKKILETFTKKYPGTPVPLVVRAEIDDVLPYVENIESSGDEEKDLVKQAGYLMSYISWSQPFADGNKRTGWISATKFLRDNGYDLDLSSQDDQKEIRKLLYDIQDQRANLDDSIVQQIIIYISKRITKHE